MAEIDNTRRHFLQALIASAAVTGLGLSSCNSGGAADEAAGARSHGQRPRTAATFRHGVASGDPLADRVILWTRLAPERPGTLEGTWEIAEDREFSAVAASGVYRTDASPDYTIKVDAEGLRPGMTYFYRFRRGDLYSPTGTTRTLPSGEVESARLAVVSCSNYPAGYFHVYRACLSRDREANRCGRARAPRRLHLRVRRRRLRIRRRRASGAALAARRGAAEPRRLPTPLCPIPQ